jgi:hypothetical protein
MNQLYHDLVVERVRAAVASARAVAPMEHAGVKGAIREVLIADLFRPLLPADIGVGTGVIISAFDEAQSAQQDIVLFDKRILPPFLFEHGPGIFPIESVLETIEVKSCLTATELRAAENNARSVANLWSLSGTRDETGKFIDALASSAGSVIFALDTDLSPSGTAEAERYKSLFGFKPAIIRGICVVDRGYSNPSERVILDRNTGQYRKEDGSEITGEWYETPSDGNFGEVLEFLLGIIEIYEKVSVSRGRPPLSSYLRHK